MHNEFPPMVEKIRPKKNCIVSGNWPGETFLKIIQLPAQLNVYQKTKKKLEDKKLKKLKTKMEFLWKI